MLYLNNNNYTNIIFCNLLDRLDTLVIPPNWSWLIQFTNDFTKENFTVIQIFDFSAFGKSADSNMVIFPLKVINTGTANGLIQEIKLKDKGYYTYKIFLQTGTTNLLIDNAAVGDLVQTGKALVYDVLTPTKFVAQKDGNPNNFIYVS